MIDRDGRHPLPRGSGVGGGVTCQKTDVQSDAHVFVGVCLLLGVWMTVRMITVADVLSATLSERGWWID